MTSRTTCPICLATGRRRTVPIQHNGRHVHTNIETETLLLHPGHYRPHDGACPSLFSHVSGSNRIGRETLTGDFHTVGVLGSSANPVRSHSTNLETCSDLRWVAVRVVGVSVAKGVPS